MNLEPSPKVRELQSRLAAFMAAHVYPNETTFDRQLNEHGRWRVPLVLEDLKIKARAEGLWNLFCSDPAYGPGPNGPSLAPGDAFTIEPGVYVSRLRLELLPDTPRNHAFRARVSGAVERHHGIGVRIEDDFLVTTRGVERISTVPREIDEIERLMRRSPR